MSPRRRGAQPKRPPRSSMVIPGDPADPTGFHRAITDWLDWLRVHNYAPATIVDRSWYLAGFVTWAEVRGITRPRDVTLPVLEAYQHHIAAHRKRDGMPLAWSTQARHLIPVRLFFAWATRTRRLLYNPASELVLPRQNHALPKPTLTHEEMETVLTLCDTTTVIGLRDRAIVEVLYATAMCRGELVGLSLPDVDLTRNWAWVAGYLADARPELVVGSIRGSFSWPPTANGWAPSG